MIGDGIWRRVDVRSADEVVAVGDDLTPAVLYGGYRAGVFPWPSPGWPAIPWCSPDPRAVITAAGAHLPRSLRPTLRRSGWTTTVDEDFGAVLTGCADREDTWITPQMTAAYRRLHDLRLAHSLEVWDRCGDLVGGLYGVAVGGVFCGESMFSRAGGASKAAVLDLLTRFGSAGGLLLDCQQEAVHLRLLGQQLIPRSQYLDLLTGCRDRVVRLPTDRRAVTELLG